MNRLTSAIRGGTETIPIFSTLLSLAILSSACDGGASRQTPLAPTGPTPPAAASHTLSGAVSETTATGSAPVEGARVADIGSGRSAVTDANGLYSISELPAANRTVSVTKDGYVAQTRIVTLGGDTQLDVKLDRIVTYILSGVVFEVTAEGQVPIAGVEVYCDSCGSPVGHTFVYTDGNGFYSLEWSPNGVHPLFVTKAGYEIFDPDGTLRDPYGRITATVQGDTRFDIRLTRR